MSSTPEEIRQAEETRIAIEEGKLVPIGEKGQIAGEPAEDEGVAEAASGVGSIALESGIVKRPVDPTQIHAPVDGHSPSVADPGPIVLESKEAGQSGERKDAEDTAAEDGEPVANEPVAAEAVATEPVANEAVGADAETSAEVVAPVGIATETPVGDTIETVDVVDTAKGTTA
jgi:hypothetical protein